MLRRLLLTAVAATALGGFGGALAGTEPTHGEGGTTWLATGQSISPTATPGAAFVPLNPELADEPNFLAGQPVSTALSPDRKTLLVLTTGYNNVTDAKGVVVKADANQYVFVFDVSGGAPVKQRVLQVPNTYVGIAFSPDGQHFYVTGGNDDNLHIFTITGSGWVEDGQPIALKHTGGNGLGATPLATGVDVTGDSKFALVANRYQDSVTLVDLRAKAIVAETDLRPGKSGGQSGRPGGEYPNSVRIVGNRTAYVSSERDREIVVLDLAGSTPKVTARIPVKGNPNKMVLNRAQNFLFVASDNADVVSIIDTAANKVVTSVSTLSPEGLTAVGRYRGASPNGLSLSPDEQTLYVTNRGTNDIAVISLGEGRPRVAGLIPTGWYPSDVAAGANGMLYVVNTKNVPGPNPGHCRGLGATPCPAPQQGTNDYVLQLTKGGFMSMPVPNRETLRELTLRVARNNGFTEGTREGSDENEGGNDVMPALRKKIKHVIYIIKENRTYDQVLGDLGRGNGAAALAEFPQATTPNSHNLARNFTTLDNFYDSGDVSGDGWPWSTGARESDAGAKMLPVNSASSPDKPGSRGGSYDWEGSNRNVNVGLAGAARQAANPALPNDPDLLPGTADVGAPDGPSDAVQQGYIWNAALRAGLTVRNYGCFVDTSRYFGTSAIPADRTPFADNVVQAYAASPELVNRTDPFFRGYDQNYPDLYRELEWEREFQGFSANGQMPSLTLMRLPHDHTGSFATAIDGVNTPELQVADNDYAVGRIAQAVANSPYADDTLIFVVEDDAQDGPDHVDAHRSTAFVIGPYVRQGAVVSQRYTTVNLIRTITDVLGLDHLGVLDATQGPMNDIFDLDQRQWTYKASASALLKNTKLPIPASDFQTAALKPTHSMRYWARATKGMDFTVEDKVDAVVYNKVLWAGLMAAKPYPKRMGDAAAPQLHRDADDD